MLDRRGLPPSYAVMSNCGKKKTKLTLLHSEWPKLYGVSAILKAIGLTEWPKLYGLLAILSAIEFWPF